MTAREMRAAMAAALQGTPEDHGPFWGDPEAASFWAYGIYHRFIAATPPAPLDVGRARRVFHNEYEADTERYFGCRHVNQHRSTWDCQQRVDEFAAAYEGESE